jgi:hypothetical protein
MYLMMTCGLLRLRAGTGRASLERGDILVVLPDEGLVVTDVSVVHPAATSYLQWAEHTAGTAACTRDAAKSCTYGGGGQVAPLLSYPWNPTGAWAGQQYSFCEPWPTLLPPLQRLGQTLLPPPL